LVLVYTSGRQVWSTLAHPTNSHNFLSPIPAFMCGIGEVDTIDCEYSKIPL
jgi:hypothetical protein